MASIAKRDDGRWRARYRDDAGKEHAQHFTRKVDAQRWLDSVASSQLRGDYVDPKLAKATVNAWCETWLAGYRSRRPRTVRQAEVHLKLICREFGPVPLSALRPSNVRAWTAKLKAEGRADSYVYALHSRLSQIMSDAVHDGVIARNPCSRRTSPRTGSQRPYVATTEQIWALHDAVPPAMSASILLGAFVGLRLAEVAALRVSDVDFMRGVVTPAIQWPANPLKSETSRTAVPIPNDLALLLAECWKGNLARGFVLDEYANPANPWTIQRGMRDARAKVRGLPPEFRFQDLRHYFASLLIADGLDVKVVQARLRHASAKTTLDVYGHLWPDRDEVSRAAVSAAIAARPQISCGLFAD
ncbi:tyrosine-type recombinase/integrase [uncultured Jatrophihabitans sp.]|uniref:tyrosine-type recombinase/integrase n=1 Tax=uncultured Jatrophihabitans sp. TaxID=1610747 RepID=UPI0035CB71D2